MSSIIKHGIIGLVSKVPEMQFERCIPRLFIAKGTFDINQTHI